MRRARTLGSNAGFTYIAAIVTVVIMGILLSQAAGVWKTTMQRERETELVFRGMQIRDALRRYYGLTGKVATIPPGRPSISQLKDLLQAPESAGKKRYLRKLYLDPITGKDWALVKDASQRVIGVASTSELKPLKQANFPLELEPADFEGKKKYSEWQFRCDRVPRGGAVGGGVTGLGGSSNPAVPLPQTPPVPSPQPLSEP